MIEEGKITKAEDGEARVTYLIEGNNEPDNLVYDEMRLRNTGKTKG
jgi:hypothetical protein